MNTYKKYCPNVFVAQCKEKHEKGDTIIVETKYGKENECIVHNFIGYTGTKEKPMYCYSITRVDGYNSQERAKNKVENEIISTASYIVDNSETEYSIKKFLRTVDSCNSESRSPFSTDLLNSINQCIGRISSISIFFLSFIVLASFTSIDTEIKYESDAIIDKIID